MLIKEGEEIVLFEAPPLETRSSISYWLNESSSFESLFRIRFVLQVMLGHTKCKRCTVIKETYYIDRKIQYTNCEGVE